MKKLTVILVIAAFVTLFNSCKLPLGPDENSFLKIFPAKVNNYWVYKTIWKDNMIDKVETEHLDSMVVTKVITGGSEPVVVISYYRDGRLFDTLSAQISKNSLNIYTQLFFPFLGYDYNQCICVTSTRWITIAAETIGSVELRDSIEGDSYPSLVDDSLGGYKTVISRTAWIFDFVINKMPDKTYSFNNKNYISHVFNTNGYLDYLIVDPPNVQFKKIDNGCLYSDNDRKIRANDMNLNMSFVLGIGIVHTDGNIYACGSLVHKQTRELLRYKIN